MVQISFKYKTGYSKVNKLESSVWQHDLLYATGNIFDKWENTPGFSVFSPSL